MAINNTGTHGGHSRICIHMKIHEYAKYWLGLVSKETKVLHWWGMEIQCFVLSTKLIR